MKLQSCFQSGWAILHSHQQCMTSDSSIPHPHQHLLLSSFNLFNQVIVTQMCQDISFDQSCISVIINGISIFSCAYLPFVFLLKSLFKFFFSFLFMFSLSLTKLIREIETDIRFERYTALQEIEIVKALCFFKEIKNLITMFHTKNTLQTQLY